MLCITQSIFLVLLPDDPSFLQQRGRLSLREVEEQQRCPRIESLYIQCDEGETGLVLYI